MTPVGFGVQRSRFIRKIILDQLMDLHQELPGVPLDGRQIYIGFDGGRTQFTRAEIDAEIADLVEDGLAAIHRTPRLDAPQQIGYLSTSRGRDFHRAGCPWEKIDEFTGGRR